jgi:hypothetical protein
MMFRKFDAGVVDRPKGAPTQDCQVRALTTARGIPYNEAWNILYEIQSELRRGAFTLVESLTASDPRLGSVEKIPFPAVRGRDRMTAEKFCKKYSKGRYILRMAHHVAAVKDGVLYDTADTSRCCVYTAWKVTEVQP